MSPRKPKGKSEPLKVKKTAGPLKNAGTLDSPNPKAETKPFNAAQVGESSLSPHYIAIDHPASNENIYGTYYAIRIGASDVGKVEVSINDGQWYDCRNSAGYWWYDWHQFKPGSNTIVARLKDGAGKILKKSIVCKCNVL